VRHTSGRNLFSGLMGSGITVARSIASSMSARCGCAPPGMAITGSIQGVNNLLPWASASRV
jgi:hypothetical protein